MGTVPTPVADEFDDDHPIINAAVEALTHVGGDLTRDQGAGC
jgi:hypothetical protein